MGGIVALWGSQARAAEPSSVRVVPLAPGEAQVERAASLSWDLWLVVAAVVAAPLVLAVLWFADVLRPGSLSRGKARDPGAQPAVIWLFCAGMTYLAMPLAAAVALSTPWIVGSDPEAASARALASAFACLAGLLCGLALCRLITSAPGAQRTGLTVRPRDLPVGLGAALLMGPVVVAFMLATTLLYKSLTGSAPDPIAHGTLHDIRRLAGVWPGWVLIAVAVVGVPVVEEIIYRGFLQSAFLRAGVSLGLNPWVGLFAASLAFAAVHAPVVPWHALPTLALLGVAFGLAFERTGRLGVPIVMHAAFNAANITAVLLV